MLQLNFGRFICHIHKLKCKHNYISKTVLRCKCTKINNRSETCLQLSQMTVLPFIPIFMINIFIFRLYQWFSIEVSGILDLCFQHNGQISGNPLLQRHRVQHKHNTSSLQHKLSCTRTICHLLQWETAGRHIPLWIFTIRLEWDLWIRGVWQVLT